MTFSLEPKGVASDSLKILVLLFCIIQPLTSYQTIKGVVIKVRVHMSLDKAIHTYSLPRPDVFVLRPSSQTSNLLAIPNGFSAFLLLSVGK